MEENYEHVKALLTNRRHEYLAKIFVDAAQFLKLRLRNFDSDTLESHGTDSVVGLAVGDAQAFSQTMKTVLEFLYVGSCVYS